MRKLLIILPIVASLSACGSNKNNADRSLPIVLAQNVALQNFTDQIDAIGTAFANEQAVLSAPVTERITQLNFSDGGYVQSGQIVAVLAQGQESAQLSQASAQEREAEQQLNRLAALKARGFATNAAVDTQTALVSSARAQAASARASMGDRVIRAPFSGWISLRNISRGAVVTAGSEVATISDISQIKVDFSVPETQLAMIQVGQTIDASVAAFPNQKFQGKIASINPVVDANSRAVTVRAILPNGDARLKPGMLVTVAIKAASRDSVAVPELAVVGEGDSRYIYVIQSGDKVKRVPVKTGLRQNGLIEITSGLMPGQKVVTEGVIKLSDGQKVRYENTKAAPKTVASGK